MLRYFSAEVVLLSDIVEISLLVIHERLTREIRDDRLKGGRKNGKGDWCDNHY